MNVGVVRALGPIDLRSVRRDSLLRWMFALPILLALLIRFATPPTAAWLDERYGVELGPFLPLLASVLAMATPMIYGAVIGFLLLDQKDDNTLTALQVTPLTTGDYLLYRLGVPVLLSIGMTLVVFEISAVATVGWRSRLLVSVAAAPMAPMFAVFLAAFARNKVQGFALMKAAGVINWPPMIAWFVHSDWVWAFGLSPTFWPAKLYWELAAEKEGVGWLFLVAIGYAGVLTWALLRRFDRQLHQ